MRAITALIAIAAIVVASALLHSSAFAAARSYEECVIEEMRGQSIFMEPYVRELCAKRFPQQAAPQQAPATAQSPVQRAVQVTVQSINECRTKRLRGELNTYAASAQCSNPAMIAAFNKAHYKYMDLIEWFALKRLEVARRIDRHELTEDQARLESEKNWKRIGEAEQQRDNAK